ncbi:MAG: 1-deoxy-D-xylulose-5-phosphate synthase [Lachnospiraceae bacterium]|nr:1-deoxy-D-xylulose-5-phosphate synthase [Lachnospiraceae bacterium]
MTVLETINKANDIKNIDPQLYDNLASEIRAFLLEKVSKHGGHLASNLGAVELTMALHLCLTFPEDKLIWDVGHQSYVHKILTGRKEGFDSLRQLDGMSGFPKIAESDTDAFNTGHSSTSLSVALGMAKARDLKGDKNTIVAVIGDGALSGGMAFEALNNMGQLKSNLIIILNDNKMSISENVGGLSKYLNRLRVGNKYNNFKGSVERTLLKIPNIGEPIAKTVKRSKDSIKSLVVPGMFFEDMGITYVGPIDGHDVKVLKTTIENAKKLNRPIIIHVLSKKGKGYALAERYPDHFHGVNPFDVNTGKALVKKEVSSYTDIFSKTLIKLAKTNTDIVAITAAMADGTGLNAFAKEYKNRFFDVGIAEEHAVTFAAGMAASGLRPVVAVYSSFLQRAYDQILHDVCISRLPVVFAVDRSGLVGQDGDTHQGIFDTSYLSSLPNMTIIAPKNRYELSRAMEFAFSYDGPVAIKYPRGDAYYELKGDNRALELGKGEVIYKSGKEKGNKIAIVAVGSMMKEANEAYLMLKEKGHLVTLVNPVFIKPFDKKMIKSLAKNHDVIITVEDNVYQGGFGQMIASYLRSVNSKTELQILAIDDKFVEHGTVSELRRRLGIDALAIYERAMKYL